MSVVETKVGLVVLGAEGARNLGSNDDINPRADSVEDTHPHCEKHPTQSGVTCVDSNGLFSN